MTLAEVLATAFSALRSNLLRTLLTMLGVVIGIAAVITLTAASEGAQKGVGDRIRGLGSNLMFVRPGAVEASGVQLPGSGPSLYLEDARALEDAGFSYVEAVAAQASVGGPDAGLLNTQVIHLGQNKSTVLLGTEPSYEFVRDFVCRARAVH